MKLTTLHGNRLVNYNIKSYIINWDRKVSKPQKLTKDFLKKYWKNDIVCEELRILGSLLRIDLVNFTKKIIIEVSPRELHVDYNKFFHNGRGGFHKKLTSDAQKLIWAENNGFKFIELYNEDLDSLSKQYLKEKFDLDL